MASQFLLLITTLLAAAAAATATAAIPTAADFIKTSCAATSYPTLCIHTLTPYAPTIRTSTRRLAVTALSVSLSTAKSTKSYVSKLQPSKPREAAAVKDCAEEIEDTVDRLTKSIKELKAMAGGRAGGGGAAESFEWHLSNIETWVSAALTDESTCVDGFGGKAMDGEVREVVRGKVERVVHLTSNGLALVNRYADSVRE
ncbi:Pectinesterase inhibitor 11 [Linum perenne]